jgi:hypothetical protein
MRISFRRLLLVADNARGNTISELEKFLPHGHGFEGGCTIENISQLVTNNLIISGVELPFETLTTGTIIKAPFMHPGCGLAIYYFMVTDEDFIMSSFVHTTQLNTAADGFCEDREFVYDAVWQAICSAPHAEFNTVTGKFCVVKNIK